MAVPAFSVSGADLRTIDGGVTDPGSRPRRRLIVNADDFGQSAGVNDGIVRCHEHGILTSASMMVRWPHARSAAAYARASASLSVGLHLDLGEWVYHAHEWVERYHVVEQDNAAAVQSEIARQLDMFRQLVGDEPTHIDSHQHVHLSSPVNRLVCEVGAALDRPVRHFTNAVAYRGDFYGQSDKGEPMPDTLSVESLLAILRAIPVGTTELGCHPGLHGDAAGMYVFEREREVRTLCDLSVREVIVAERIELISFRDLARDDGDNILRP